MLKEASSNSEASQFSRRFEIRRIRVERVILLEQSQEAPGRKSRDRPKPNSDGLFALESIPRKFIRWFQIPQLALEGDLRNPRTDMRGRPGS